MALKKRKVKNKKKIIRKRLLKKKNPAKNKQVKRKPIKKSKILKKKPAKRLIKKRLKKPAKKPVKKSPKKTISRRLDGIEVGTITHYFPHVQAAVIKLKCPLSIGDNIKIKGHTTDLTQTVVSMQINRVPVNSAKSGQEIGILVKSRVRHGDLVTKC
jgi:hypothetical protein